MGIKDKAKGMVEWGKRHSGGLALGLSIANLGISYLLWDKIQKLANPTIIVQKGKFIAEAAVNTTVKYAHHVWWEVGKITKAIWDPVVSGIVELANGTQKVFTTDFPQGVALVVGKTNSTFVAGVNATLTTKSGEALTNISLQYQPALIDKIAAGVANLYHQGAPAISHLYEKTGPYGIAGILGVSSAIAAYKGVKRLNEYLKSREYGIPKNVSEFFNYVDKEEEKAMDITLHGDGFPEEGAVLVHRDVVREQRLREERTKATDGGAYQPAIYTAVTTAFGLSDQERKAVIDRLEGNWNTYKKLSKEGKKKVDAAIYYLQRMDRYGKLFEEYSKENKLPELGQKALEAYRKPRSSSAKELEKELYSLKNKAQ